MNLYRNEKLEDFNNYVRNKKVAIIGIGVSNIPLLEYFYNLSAEISIFDIKQKESLNKEIAEKIDKYNINYYGGEDNLNYLIGFDIIFRSPSIMPYIKELKAEHDRGAIITSEIEMVLKLSPCKIIGITGTEGKTTTTSIIYEIIKKAGYKCYLGGNIGKPIFTKIEKMTPNDIVLLELSSFQLMNINISPDISLVTNIYPDHLNIHSSYAEYQNAKKNIFKHQNENGIVVLNYDNEITRSFAKDVNSKIRFFSSKTDIKDGYVYDDINQTIKYNKDGIGHNILTKSEIKIRGIHNYENICAALAVTEGIASREQQIEAIKEFCGVEHRLEFVRELNGVKWYNDSIGTSPASTIAALNAFEENIILLAGGSDKGLDYTEIGEAIAKNVGILILCGPTSIKIEKSTKIALNKFNKNIEIYNVSNLKEAVNLANNKSKSGDIVLLSPASASFDAFENFAQRGAKFKELVNFLEM